MALTATSFMDAQAESVATKKTGINYLSSNTISRLNYQFQQDAVTAQEAVSYNNGGFLGGIGYMGEKVAVGFMSSIEGIWDYAAGGLAKLFGADDWAEQQFANDWFGDWYSHPEEWYNPSKGWQVAGDVAGGIGTSLPAILASVGAVAIAVGTPVSAGILSAVGGGTAAVTAGLGAAGNATKQAYRETGQLTGKEFGYGALSGTTEGAMEGLTTALSLGTGQIVKSITKSFAKETAKTVAKQSVVKTLAKGFIGEAFEEGVQEIIDPYWQRLTYDPEAQNATPQEVAYAAFVGGMSGMLMGGAGAVYSSGNSFLKGNSLVGKGLDAEVVGLSQQLAAFETANNTGDETFQNIAQTYADLARSLETTGGKVTTVTQKKLLGDLQRANTVAVFKPMIARSAANIVNNAEVIAERLNAYGYKTADGKPFTFTADQLRAGVDVNRPSSFSEALKTNSILRELAIADTTGHLVMDTARFEQATLMGKRLASQVDLNRFIETATPSEISAVSQALGIENWATLDVDTFNQKITSFVENGGVQQYADRRATVQSIQAIPAETARPMPKMVNLRQDGTVRYSDSNTQIAITRQGDAYTVYDYASGHLSKNMTRSEVNKLLRDYNTQQADILAGARAQMEAESELRRQAEEIDTYARENIADYTKLSAPNQSMIRKVIREGRAKGMTDEDVLTYAKISAHAGIDISFDKQATFRGHDAEGKAHYVDGFYDPKTNRIVVNPEAKRSHERLLLHELEHTILNGKDGKKMIATAFKNMDEAMRNKIIDRYSKFYEGKGLDAADRIDIFNDEISAHFAEEILSNRHTLERLVEAEPTLKDKILSFFKGASEDYKSVPKLSRAARSYYKTYKKLFDEFAERNFQNNATEAQTARLSGEVKAQRRALPNSIGAYSDEERKSIEARKDNITARSYDDVLEFFEYSISDKSNEGKTMFVGKISSKTAAKIRKATGLNAFNKSIALNSHDLRHMMKEHGDADSEAMRNQEAITADNFEYVIETIADPDEVTSEKDEKSGVLSLIFKKEIAGKTTAITIFSEKRKALTLKTAWIIKKEQHISQPTNAEALIRTPEARSSMDTVPTDSITDPAENVNRNSEISYDERHALPETDSEGANLTAEQREFFKDSVIRDKDGKLLVLYHGTAADFNIFDLKETGKSNNQTSHVGFWFTPQKEVAEHFAEFNSNEYLGRIASVKTVYLNLKNPKIYEPVDNSARIAELRKEIEDVLAENKTLFADLQKTVGTTNWLLYFDTELGRSIERCVGFRVGLDYYMEIMKLSEEKAKHALSLVDSLKTNLAKRSDNLEQISRLEDGDSFMQMSDDLDEFMEWIYPSHNYERGFGRKHMMGMNGREAAEKYRNKLIEQGYDGIWIKDTRMDDSGDQIVAFYSEQAKLVTNQSPTENPDVRYSLPDTDTKGKALTPEQQKFFADSAIKAVQDDGSLRISPDGALMPVYHGTNNGEFYEFDKNLSGSSNDAGWYGKGFYFAFRKGEAEYYGRRVLECYLNIKNPFVFDDEMQAYDGVTSGDILFDFASFVLNMAEKFPDIAKKMTVEVAEHSYGDSSEVTEKNFVDLAAELKEIYDSKRLSVVEVRDDVRGDHYEYRIDNDVENMDIPADLKKVIQEQYINSASWAEYLRKEGEITREQYEDILDAMDKYGERNFETVYLHSRFETRKRAEAHRLSAALQYLSEKKYSYLEQHIPEHFMTRIGNEFSAEIQRRGYDGVLQSLYGDEVVAFDANQIKLTSNTAPTSDSDMRYALPETDSEGNALSAGQREYFADSKVLDENGNLLLVYHGTRKADFTEFRRNVNYFTDSAEMADSYSPNGERYAGYLNITNPYIIDAGGEKWSRIPIDDETKQFLDERGSSTFEEDGAWRTTPADIAAAIEEAVDDGEMDYDGIIIRNVDDTGSYSKTGKSVVANDYITFRSNQFKNADNASPTADKDIRHALPDEDLDALFDDDADGSNSAQDATFDAEAVVARGMPRTAEKSSLTVGELRKIIANNTKQKVYSKQDALSVVGRFAGISDLTQKTRTEIADAVWQILNESPDVEYRRDVAHDMAEFIVAKIIVDAKTENPDALEAQERLSYLRTGIGKLSFSEEDMSEIRHVRDKKGLKQVLGRWGYKGAHKVAGASGVVSSKRTPMDVFVVDIAREMPAMEYLEEMHPVDAFLEIDSLYERALAESKDKWISAYWDMPDSEIPSMIKSVEDEIMRAYETEGEQSKFSRMVENKIGYYSERAEYWKAEYDKIKGRDRLLGLLMSKAQKMKDLKLGTFANSTQHDSEIFKNSIEQLARIQFRGNLNVSGTRKILADLRQWYTSDAVKTGILEYVDANSTGLYVQGVADMLETLSEGKKGFTKDDLKMLYDVMSYFTNFVENWGKVFRQGKWIEAKPEAERYINTLHANESLKVGLFSKLAGTTYMQTFGDPMTVARRMDMYESGFYTEMMQELRDAAVDAQVAEMEIRSAYDEFTKKHKKYVEKASVDTVSYRGTEIPKMHLIGLYMTMKRKHAWAGLAANGFAFTDTKGKRVRVNGVVSPEAKITNAELEQYTKEQLSAIEALLTDTDKEYIAILEQAFNVDARKLKADRDMQRLGFTNATNDYYYPIRRGNIAKNVDTADIAGELDRVSNSSFNKDTVRGAKQELFIESADAVFNRHIHAVCQYAYLSPAVEAYNRLYNLDISGNKNKPISVATESANTWDKGNKYFVKLISDIQGIPATSSEGMKALGFIRGSYAKFQLGANPKVWFTQLSSIFASSSLLDADSITRGMAVSSKGMDEYCSLAKLRNNDNTAAMAQGVLDSKAKRAVGAVSKFSDLLMSPIGKMDRFVVGRLFGACQVQVQKNGGAKIGTEANKVEAGKLLRRVILETQQNAVATERSAAMRSGNEIMRTLTMFTSDSMKVVGRVIDAIGEVATLKSKLKATTDADTRSALKQQLKAANRKARKAVGALCLTAVFMASIAQLFRWLYDKEQDEDESVAETMLVDAVGNLFGGLPLFKDAYAKIFEGYDVDNYAYSAVNDLLDSALNLFEVAGNILTNEGSVQERNRAMRDLAYSVGQLFGIPVRNIYNVFFGLTKRFNPETAYVIDNAFYEKNYQNELYKAIEEDDAEMTSFIMSLLLGERMNENVDEAVFNELLILSKNGQKVIPRSVPSSITIDEVEYPLSAAEQASIKDVYATSEKSLKALFAKSKYNTLSDEQKAAAIDFIYDTYYDKALEGALGIDRGNNNLVIADVVGVDNLALLYVTTKGLTSDMDRRGKVISGSKRKKVVAAINSLGVSTEKKLLLICAKGYSLQDNDIRGLSAAKAKKYLLRYILSLKGKTKAEKAEIAELCGFEVKNGRVVTKSVFSIG